MTEKWGEIQGKWYIVRVSGVLPMADLGEEPEGPAPPLFLENEKKCFETAPPPYLRVWVTAPPPFLKVWIRHCLLYLSSSIFNGILILRFRCTGWTISGNSKNFPFLR